MNSLLLFSIQCFPDGKLSDDDPAKDLYIATENPASAFRSRGTHPVLRFVEMMGAQWGLLHYEPV